MKNATIDNIKYITYNSCVDVLVFFYDTSDFLPFRYVVDFISGDEAETRRTMNCSHCTAKYLKSTIYAVIVQIMFMKNYSLTSSSSLHAFHKQI